MPGKALLPRGLERDWKEGSKVPSSVPVASPDVLGPSPGAELEPGKDTHTHALPWAPPPRLFSEPAPRALLLPEPRLKHSSWLSHCSQTSALKGTPGHPAQLLLFASQTGSDYSKVTQPATGRARTRAQSYCWLVPPTCIPLALTGLRGTQEIWGGSQRPFSWQRISGWLRWVSPSRHR